MGNFFTALKKGVQAARGAVGPGRYTVLDRALTCAICMNDTFVERSVLLNTFRMLLLEMGWADKSATALICTKCGYIHWFGKKPERTSDAKR